MGNERTQEENAFLEGFHDIPSKKELDEMSFVKLASALSQCSAGSAKFLVIENAMLRHEESAQRNNTVLGAKVGGTFTVVGAIIGGALALVATINAQPQIIQCQSVCGGEEQSHNQQESAIIVPEVRETASVIHGSEEVNIPPPPIKTKSE